LPDGGLEQARPRRSQPQPGKSASRIISKAWTEESTSPHVHGEGLFFYGYQWWLGRSLVNRQDVKWISAVGWGASGCTSCQAWTWSWWSWRGSTTTRFFSRSSARSSCAGRRCPPLWPPEHGHRTRSASAAAPTLLNDLLSKKMMRACSLPTTGDGRRWHESPVPPPPSQCPLAVVDLPFRDRRRNGGI
jgi:hypothetical protein